MPLDARLGMADTTPRVLLADDQPDVIAALRLLLRAAGFEAHGAASVEEVRTLLAARDFDAVLMDLNYARDTTSGVEGLDLIADLHASQPHLPLIAMTGWANVETAVEAMRRGARGYIPKPWDNNALVQVRRAGIDHARSHQPAREWREAQAIHRPLLPASLPDLPGCHVAWRWEPASGFGGDYYDAFLFAPDRLALCIADVCGKGLPAALLVSSLQATVRAFVTDDATPQDAVGRINRALCRQGAHGRFVTLFIAMLDAGRSIVGVFDGAAYGGGCATIAAGDRLLLFTDGLVEAGSSELREYGDVHQWAGRRLDDDATAVARSFDARP